MEYEEDQEEEQEGEIPSYDDSLPNSTRPASPKLNSPVDSAPRPTPPSLLRKCRYKECLKNHAVGIGGHAVDGCGEFIAAGEEGSLESLRCAACNCHRNFHRKDAEGGGAAAFFPFPQHQHQHQQQQLLLTHHGHFGYRGGGYVQVAPAQQQQRAALLALPSSSGGGGSREEAEEYNYYSNPSQSGSQKKRFRTKFTQEQKEKMLGFAERLGWKIQKQDEELVLHFCNDLGIKRHVLKVWMHNNKHTLANPCFYLPTAILLLWVMILSIT